MNPEIVQKLIEAIKTQDDAAALALCEEMLTNLAGGAGGESPPADPTAAASEPPPVDEKKPDPEAAAMASLGREVVRLSKASNPGDAAELVRGVFAAAEKIESDRAALEQSARRGLVAELVKIGAETPATAWKRNDEGEIGEGDKRVPVKRLADEPIAELRSRVAAIKAGGGTRGKEEPARETVTVPAGPNAKLAAAIKRSGLTVEEFNAKKNSAVRRNK
jgi:hypothetical protein